MSEFYEEMQGIASELLGEFKQGVVTVSRSTTAPPAAETPWIPGAKSTNVYELDAAVMGVPKKYVDGTVIVVSDLLVTASPLAVHKLTDGVAADGATVELEIAMTDVLSIDGKLRTVKKIDRIPAAGVAVGFRIFVAG